MSQHCACSAEPASDAHLIMMVNVLFSNKILVFRAGNHKMLVGIANREDTDQTASSEAV